MKLHTTFTPSRMVFWNEDYSMPLQEEERYVASGTDFLVVGFRTKLHRDRKTGVLAGNLPEALIVRKRLANGQLERRMHVWERRHMNEAQWQEFTDIFAQTRAHSLHQRFQRVIAEDLAQFSPRDLSPSARRLAEQNPHWKVLLGDTAFIQKKVAARKTITFH